VRNYSLIDARSDLATYTLGIKRDPASRGGSRLIHDELRVGKTLKISAPRNNFPLKEDAAQTILLAGGIGIVPIWCMVQRLAELGRPWQLFYSCRSRPDMAFAQELEKMPAARLHFDDQNGGRVLDIAGVMAQAPKDAHLYCCGPTPMMQAFEAAVAQWPRAQIHVEYFTAKEQEPVRLGGFTVELARSGKEFFIPEGETILDILLDDGIDLESSCENGICGSCEQQVIAGIPLHCDSILSEEERAENKRVMICCAGCKTERLVLDL
jgi:ferredoxin-NADP reductase